MIYIEREADLIFLKKNRWPGDFYKRIPLVMAGIRFRHSIFPFENSDFTLREGGISSVSPHFKKDCYLFEFNGSLENAPLAAFSYSKE